MNQHPARKRHIAAILLVACSLGCLYLGLRFKNEPQEVEKIKQLKCVLDIKAHDDTTRGLVNGYNYTLLKRFASETGIKDCSISLAGNSENMLDSLKSGVIDILVLPAGVITASDSIEICGPCDTISIWAVRADLGSTLDDLRSWSSECYDSLLRDRYYNTFNNPLKAAKYGIKREFLSPYDSLFKVYAPKLGWDWRLLAAVAWQESRFHIEAHSHRGASGLMQLMPGTIQFLDADNILDPEQSIKAGTEYLAWIERIFRRKSLDRWELAKFTLAAYNAGQGKIKDCINYAQYKGVFDSTWACIPAIIPDMRSDSILSVDTVKLGKFKGEETVAYVDNVMDIYESFTQIVPF